MVHFTGILLRIIKQCSLFSDLYVTLLFSLSHGGKRTQGTKNASKIDATVNFFQFFSAVAAPQIRLDFHRHKKRVLFIKNN